MKKAGGILLFFVLSIFLLTTSVVATPVVDGVFDTTEWAGYYSDDNGVRSSDGFVDPGWGGQSFDVEYLGLYFDSTKLYFGLQTGFNLETGVGSYGPGDFGLDADGDGFYEYAIDYSITSSGVDYTLVDMNSSKAHWEDVSYFPSGNPWQAHYNSAAVIGEFSFSNGYATTTDPVNMGPSYVLEGSFDLALLTAYTAGNDMTIHWTMECGNDYLNQTSAPVPEPATMLLFGTGLIGMAAIGRRKFIKQARGRRKIKEKGHKERHAVGNIQG